MKVILSAIAIFTVLFLTAISLINGLRESEQLVRDANLFQLRDQLVVQLPDRNNYELIEPVSHEHSTKGTSWREKVANNFREHSGGGDHSYIFRLESPIDQSHKRHTSVVAVIGEKTVWDEQTRKIVLTKPVAKESMDKILLIEVPHETIDWDSPVDYDVSDALQLWNSKPMYRGFWRKPGIRYITILGKRGDISEFQSREDFKRRLVYSKEELDLLMSLPIMEHIPKITE